MSNVKGSKNRSTPRGMVRVQSSRGVAAFTDGGHAAFRVTIPAPVARLVGPERLFRVELTDDGILLRYMDGGDPVPALPAWLQ